MAERAPVSQQTRNIASQPNTVAMTPKFVEPEAIHDRMSELYEAIARRAFELFEEDDRVFGRDLDHWFKAEAELLHPAHVR